MSLEIKKTKVTEVEVGMSIVEVDYAPFIPKKWEKIGIYMPSNESAYRIMTREGQEWVESQPIHMWKYSYASLGMYIFTEEMEVWFLLRWS